MTTDAAVFEHSLEFQIPFNNSKQSKIALNSLKPDPLLKPDELIINYSIIDGTVLSIKFNGLSDRIIRVAANNIIENLKTVVECFEAFEMSA